MGTSACQQCRVVLRQTERPTDRRPQKMRLLRSSSCAPEAPASSRRPSTAARRDSIRSSSKTKSTRQGSRTGQQRPRPPVTTPARKLCSLRGREVVAPELLHSDAAWSTHVASAICSSINENLDNVVDNLSFLRALAKQSTRTNAAQIHLIVLRLCRSPGILRVVGPPAVLPAHPSSRTVSWAHYLVCAAGARR
jgi:hypothetical protein